MKQYDFLTRLQYFQALSTASGRLKSGERLVIATMDFDPDEPHIAELIASMMSASKRGVRVTFMVDAIALLTGDHGLPVLSLSRNRLKVKPGPIAARRNAIEILSSAGVECRIVNIPTRRVGLLQQGRSHIKCAVAGDELFVGGCNLSKPEQIDIMVHWRDPGGAEQLASWLKRIAQSEQTRDALRDVDIDIQLDSQTHLLLDAGVPRQSIIYEDALRLISEARESLYITCQYFPGGETARYLAAAQARGVTVTIAYSHPKAHHQAAVLHHAHQLAQRRRRLPAAFFAGRLDKKLPKLHAKILVSEREAMVGSHNYVPQGVNFGTAELALKSTDQAFGKDLREFVQQQINELTK